MDDLRIAQVWEREHYDAPGLRWAPIQESLEPPSRGMVRLAQAAGFLTALLLFLLLLNSHGRKNTSAPFVTAPGIHAVAVTLHSPKPNPRVAPGTAPSGAGHVRGTDSIDPALKRAAVQHRLPGQQLAEDPALRGTVAGGEAGPDRENLDLSLPESPGGTGWARGFGRDATRGGLKATPAVPKIRFDFRLVVLHQELAYLAPPYTAEEKTTPVVVVLTIGEDGVPTQVRPLSGPSRRFPEVMAAAMKWRFEALTLHGLTAPYELRLKFFPNELKTRR